MQSSVRFINKIVVVFSLVIHHALVYDKNNCILGKKWKITSATKKTFFHIFNGRIFRKGTVLVELFDYPTVLWNKNRRFVDIRVHSKQQLLKVTKHKSRVALSPIFSSDAKPFIPTSIVVKDTNGFLRLFWYFKWL